jgi:hypothetical protein
MVEETLLVESELGSWVSTCCMLKIFEEVEGEALGGACT